MFRSVPMSKVLLCGPKEGLDALADLLHRLHRAHVVKAHKPPEGFEPGRPLAAGTKASEQLVQLRSLKSTLPALPPYSGPILRPAEVQTLIEGTLQEAEQKLLKKMAEREDISRKLETVRDTAKNLLPFQALQLNLDHYQPFTSLASFVGTAAKDPETDLQAAGLNFELFRGDARAPQAIALFVEKDKASQAGDILAKLGFREERLVAPTPGLTDYQTAPAGHYTGGVDTLAQELQKKAANMDAAVQALDRDIEKLRETWAHSCLPAEEHLQIQVDKSELPFESLVTAHAYMLEFWLPDSEVADVKAELEKNLGDSFHFEVVQHGAGDHSHPDQTHAKHDYDERAGEHAPKDAHAEEAAHGGHGHGDEEPVPVKLNNPPYFSLFEMLTKMFSTPKYDELDPTIFLSIFFPIYFGLMVGDLGYGVLIALLGAVAFKAGKKGSDLRSIGMFLISGGVVAAVTGYFVFWDLFGIPFKSHEPVLTWSGILGVTNWPGLGDHPPIHKLDAAGVNEFLVLSLIFGMVHMGLGFLLGSWNEIKHSVKHGVAKLAWFCVLQALGLVVLNLDMCRNTGLGKMFWHTLSFLEESPGVMSLKIWGAIGGFGVVALLVTEPAGLVELLGPLSNTISYTRLAGIAVAKAALASAMNQMILPLGHGWGIPFCILLLLIAHAMILGLGILSGAVQAMRLNFFEFFSKFMAGGGTDYAPFGRVRQYTAAD